MFHGSVQLQSRVCRWKTLSTVKSQNNSLQIQNHYSKKPVSFQSSVNHSVSLVSLPSVRTILERYYYVFITHENIFAGWTIWALLFYWPVLLLYKSSCRRCFLKRCSLKFPKFHRKHLCWRFFLVKLQARPATLLKRDSNAGVFL